MAIPGINPDFLKGEIDSMRETIGRNVTVNVRGNSPCPLCTASGYFDSISNTSYFTTCPVCSGAFWQDVEIATEVLARVHWVSDEAITATPGGKFFLGDAHITVDPSYQALLESAQNNYGNVVVDGRTMEITRINPMGAPEINRIRAILKGSGKRPEG